MNCGRSYLNTEAVIFVLQAINFHHWHKNMHAACRLPTGSVQNHTDEWTSQYRWTRGHCNMSNRKAKDNCHGVGLLSRKIYFIRLLRCCQNYPFQRGCRWWKACLGMCSLYTSEWSVSHQGTGVCAEHRVEHNRTAWQIPNRTDSSWFHSLH